MERVLARRDDSWKKLQQYVLEEKESSTSPAGRPALYGLRKEYTWFMEQGVFVHRPVKANGVTLSEADRRKAEDQWLRRETSRGAQAPRRAEAKASRQKGRRRHVIAARPSRSSTATPNQPRLLTRRRMWKTCCARASSRNSCRRPIS